MRRAGISVQWKTGFSRQVKSGLLLLVLCFCCHAGFAAPREKEPIEVIREFNKTRNNIPEVERCLAYLNQNDEKAGDPELIKELLISTRIAEDENLGLLVGFYSILKKYNDIVNNRSKSFEYSLKLYKLLSKNHQTEDLLWVLIDIGNIFYNEEDYEQAIKFYKKAENIAMKGYDKYPFSVIYLNYGLIEEDKGNYREALKYYKISCKYRLMSDNIKIISNTYLKIANVYLELENPDSCYHYLQLAEDYFYNKGTQTVLLTNMPEQIYYTHAQYHAFLKAYKPAHEYIRKAQDYCRKIAFTERLIGDVKTEAGYFFAEKKYKEAVNCILQVLPLAQKEELLEVQRDLYRDLGEYYIQLGDYKNADAAMKAYIKLVESIDYHDIRSKLNVITSIAAAYENEAKLEQTEKNIRMENMQNKLRVKQQNMSIAISIISVITIVVLLILFLNLKNNKRKLVAIYNRMASQNQEIQVNSLELERTNQLKDKLFSIIAHDLRNPLNRLMVELAIVKRSVGKTQVTAQMENTLKATVDLFEGLLQWSKLDNKQNIYSPTKVNLDENVSKVVAFYASEIEANSIRIVHHNQTLKAFADENILQTLLRNLISNAISSAVKSTGERTIEIEYHENKAGKIELVFSDSGPAFPDEVIADFYKEEDNIKSQGGFGLSICKLLSKMSGWEMHLHNVTGTSGVKIKLLLPVFEHIKKDAGSPRSLPVSISPEWKEKLEILKTFRFYQTSQIRLAIKSLGEIKDPSILKWIENVELAVHSGNEEAYTNLLDLLKD